MTAPAGRWPVTPEDHRARVAVGAEVRIAVGMPVMAETTDDAVHLAVVVGLGDSYVRLIGTRPAHVALAAALARALEATAPPAGR